MQSVAKIHPTDVQKRFYIRQQSASILAAIQVITYHTSRDPTRRIGQKQQLGRTFSRSPKVFIRSMDWAAMACKTPMTRRCRDWSQGVGHPRFGARNRSRWARSCSCKRPSWSTEDGRHSSFPSTRRNLDAWCATGTHNCRRCGQRR